METTIESGAAKCSLAMLVICLVAAQTQAQAQENTQSFTAQLDLRLVHSDTAASFTDGGLGLTRFDENHDGLQLGRSFLQYRGRLRDTLTALVTLDAYGDADKNPFDLTEAFLEWRPYPTRGWRWRMKTGAFYPPVSLENRGPGWQNVFALSPAAINTWIGEEIRTIGAEVSATWLGSRSGGRFDVSLIGGVYGWNDPAGIVIFQRGWGIHDRQTALFGGLPRLFPRGTDRPQFELFHEIDHRAGYYAGLQLEYPERLTLRALHYDNRGDPGASNSHEFAWLTRFDSIGLQFEPGSEWTAIAQWMAGDTAIGRSADGRGFLILDYDAYFALLSRSFGKHRLTARFDDFYTETVRGAQFFNSYQDGHAWTLAYMYDRDEHWQLVAEASRVDSTLEQRGLVGLPERAIEKTLQMALRYTF